MTHVDNRRRLLMERSKPGRVAVSLPACDVPEAVLPPKDLIRDGLDLPEVSQPELVRYFTHLSTLNFGVDTGFYPLGSCTMKYNPKVHEDIARLPGFAEVHPLQHPATAQGALRLMYELQAFLAEITGMQAASLAPMAGAHGEFAGMLMVRHYHQQHGNGSRTQVLVPDSAHGTNPASAAMAGFQVLAVPSDKEGNLDVEALQATLSPRTAGIMLTMPTTLGLFDPHIVEICRLVHQAGGLVYGDGANMNALLGQVKLGELGFDVVHLNLHKTFSTPHGGGGPGAGPVCAGERLAPFLPAPIVVLRAGQYHLDAPEHSIGKLGAFHGNFGVLVRAYAYIRSLGARGLRAVSENAVLNANYLLAGLKDIYHLPYQRRCMHEVVLSASRQKLRGIRALDIAKGLIDHNIHPPTMYFPLVVEEALMIEPTEGETKETLDEFIEVMHTLGKEAQSDPDALKSAPHHAPNTRLDEARAARQPDLRYTRGGERT